MDLIPVEAIRGMALGFESGLVKYPERDWERGYEFSIYYAAAMRHLTAWWGGEKLDSADGIHHLDHASSCIAILQQYAHQTERYEEFDDRPIAPSTPLEPVPDQSTRYPPVPLDPNLRQGQVSLPK